MQNPCNLVTYCSEALTWAACSATGDRPLPPMAPAFRPRWRRLLSCHDIGLLVRRDKPLLCAARGCIRSPLFRIATLTAIRCIVEIPTDFLCLGGTTLHAKALFQTSQRPTVLPMTFQILTIDLLRVHGSAREEIGMRKVVPWGDKPIRWFAVQQTIFDLDGGSECSYRLLVPAGICPPC
jgi:hypothetical protein